MLQKLEIDVVFYQVLLLLIEFYVNDGQINIDPQFFKVSVKKNENYLTMDEVKIINMNLVLNYNLFVNDANY